MTILHYLVSLTVHIFINSKSFFLTPFAEKVLPKRRAPIPLDATSCQKTTTASGNASSFSHEFPQGIQKTRPSSDVVLLQRLASGGICMPG
jgi:hypothetical protein